MFGFQLLILGSVYQLSRFLVDDVQSHVRVDLHQKLVQTWLSSNFVQLVLEFLCIMIGRGLGLVFLLENLVEVCSYL